MLIVRRGLGGDRSMHRVRKRADGPSAGQMMPVAPHTVTGRAGLWEAFRSFGAVVRHGSLTGAARELGLTTPTVARHIDWLERDAGAPLIRRTNRGAPLTAAGIELAEVVRHLEQAAADSSAKLEAICARAGRHVVLACGEGLWTFVVGPDLVNRGSADAEIRHIDQIYAASDVDGAADIYILHEAPGRDLVSPGLNLVMCRLGWLTMVPMAARVYLDRRRPPVGFSDLAAHSLVHLKSFDLNPGLAPWNGLVAAALQDGRTVHVQSSTSILHSALLSGFGIGIRPTYAPELPGAGDLVPLALSDLPDMRIELWVAADRSALGKPAVRAVFDQVKQVFARQPDWFRACASTGPAG